jgi:hypothetical protein
LLYIIILLTWHPRFVLHIWYIDMDFWSLLRQISPHPKYYSVCYHFLWCPSSFHLNIWVDLLFCLIFRLITACTGTWKASRAFYYNKGISREDRSNESTKVCLQCCGEMLDLQWSFRTPNTSQWDAWNHRWKWASSGLLNSLFLVCITSFLYLRVTIEGNTIS